MVPALLAAVVAQQQPNLGLIDFIELEREAYAVGIPRAIGVDGLVTDMHFSPMGNRALLIGTPLSDVSDILRGGAVRTGLRKWVWDGGLTARPLPGIEGTLSWDQSGSRLIERLRKDENISYRVIDAQSLAVRAWPGTFPGSSQLTFDASGTSILFYTEGGKSFLKFGDRAAVGIREVDRSVESGAIFWTGPTTGLLYTLGDDFSTFAFDTRSGTYKPSTDEMQFIRPLPGGLFVHSEAFGNELKIGLGKDEPQRLSIPRESTSVAIGLAGGKVVLSPNQDRVVYIHQGLPTVRSLTRVEYSVFEAIETAKKRAEAMTLAKEVALAVIMYSVDNDDILPPSGEKFREAVAPYLIRSDILSRFVPTLGAVDLKNIKDPSETPIGHVEGPGGRAVAYADGSVRWVPDK